MAVTVKKIVLWRKEVENRTGILANALAPLANAGTDIRVVMGYRHLGRSNGLPSRNRIKLNCGLGFLARMAIAHHHTDVCAGVGKRRKSVSKNSGPILKDRKSTRL